MNDARRDDGPDPNAVDCPFCGEVMTWGHIWIGSAQWATRLKWQEGGQVRTWVFGFRPADANLLAGGFWGAPAVKALTCPACGALVTRFDSPD